ncbi:MAG: hypothetical protein PHE17_18220 [Thiothrix sp.]|uniref:hypothetical protein n=1 Tax=Thiothrix sp. TaxID=1032 RepID=UPI002608E333|nr:hypothetical protein [Thiothrix sp.]MDD5394958.1 hypothetical protein [Thiothrix sp.]
MRYQITYKGKKYISIAEDAQAAFDKFANRKVYGENTLIGNYSLKQYDANTRGKKWAQFKCGWPSEAPFFCMCEEVK